MALSLAAPALAAEGDALTPIESSNRNTHGYGNWSKPVMSYLVPTGDGYLRVERIYGDDGLQALAERYDESFQLLSQQYLPQGIGGGLFGTNDACTRGQIVTFLYRAYK